MSNTDENWMQLAIDLAYRGLGAVEPNPMVGCVIADGNERLGQGWHQKFGGPHAEILALNAIPESKRERLATATAYVSLEPCSHQGKTGPCCDALIAAGIRRVLVAVTDSNPEVSGNGIAAMRKAGIEVQVGLLASQAEDLLAPYFKGRRESLPWVIAKWAMTVDGKIATANGDSQWISNTRSRQIVHELRGRMDAILVGLGTAMADDPLLTARPSGLRVATRVVLDSHARLPLNSQLVQTSGEFPTLIATQAQADPDRVQALLDRGCGVFQAAPAESSRGPLKADAAYREMLRELLLFLHDSGQATNVMVEGGGKLLGTLHDLGQIDEVQLFIGPKLLGGQDALGPVGGAGRASMELAEALKLQSVQSIGDDLHVVYRQVRNGDTP